MLLLWREPVGFCQSGMPAVGQPPAAYKSAATALAQAFAVSEEARLSLCLLWRAGEEFTVLVFGCLGC